ncbi:sensor histidine kinase [Halothiobacillus sp. DCM-1]|uniref:sensor histidine kinase n=1 Tax=Halothiobacillus sp. DCM-1 TaxID=3112558 RepID=UPI00324FEDE7
MRRPRWSLFSSTALALVGSVGTVLLIALGAVTWLVTVPMAQRSAQDLAGLIVLSAQTWVDTPPSARADFAQILAQEDGIRLEAVPQLSRLHSTRLPYVRFLHDALARRVTNCPPDTIDPATGECVYIGERAQGAGYWLELPVAGQILRFEFSRQRVGYQVPILLGIILIGGMSLTLLIALLVTRQLTRPITQLVEKLPQSLPEQPLPLTGPMETRLLIDAVNQRTGQVRQLQEQRTVLLAGISHDVRTPLTRLTLSLALAEDSLEPTLFQQMQGDIEQIHRLTDEVLQIARGAAQSRKESGIWRDWLSAWLEQTRARGIAITCETLPPADQASFYLATDSLRRILDNLTENAVRYGRAPYVLRCLRRDDAQVLCIEDHGAGLSRAEIEQLRQPFARKDAARTGVTGYGLGLSLANALAEAQGWRLRLTPGFEHPFVAPDERPSGLVACLIVPIASAPKSLNASANARY